MISFILALFVALVAVATEFVGVWNARKTAELYGLNIPKHPVLWHQVMMRPAAIFIIVWSLSELTTR